MWRGVIKTGVASAVHWSGVDRLLARRASVRQVPLVLGYHRVVEDFRASAATAIEPMLTSARTFERQLDWVGRRYEFVSLDELAAALEGTRRVLRPLAAVTFDDGYADVYRHALPMLRRKGIPAAVFVVTDFVGGPDLMYYDELYLLLTRAYARWRDPPGALAALLRALGLSAQPLADAGGAVRRPLRAMWRLIDNLPQADVLRVAQALRADVGIPEAQADDLRLMSWDMLRGIARDGFTVGSHSRTHARLTQEGPHKIADEVRGSRLAAERELGREVGHFCYPGGGFDRRVVDAVAAAGYRCAFTSCRHRDARFPALTVPRRLLWEKSSANALGGFSPSLMSCQVSGAFDFAPACAQAHAA